MDEKRIMRQLRRYFSGFGWTLLVYYLIMNVAVLLAGMVGAMVQMILDVASGNGITEDAIVESVISNGWGYFLAIGIGLLILRLWKGKKFCREEIYKKGEPMRPGAFLGLLGVFMMGQLVFQLVAGVIEVLLNQFGMTAMGAIESASGDTDSFSMFLYISLGAPIAEEILFRGLLLRGMEPYGKRFAVVMSAFLFGLFHGNIVQIPYAFAVGLVLGYVALNYNILWAMLLHMFNNLLFADTLTRVTASLTAEMAAMIQWLLLLAFSVVGLVALLRHRYEIKLYMLQNKMDGRCVKAFFTSPGVIVFTVLMTASAAMMITLLQ